MPPYARALLPALTVLCLASACAKENAREGIRGRAPRPSPRSLEQAKLDHDLEPMRADCIAGDADSCEQIGRYLDGGPHPLCVPNPYHGPGEDDGCGNIIRLRAVEGHLGPPPPPDPDVAAFYAAAIRIRERDCDAGDAGACEQLAEQIFHERGSPEDEARVTALRARAALLRTQSCEAGEPQACLALADASHGKLARDYEHRACAVGGLETCVELLDALGGAPLRPDMRDRERFVAAYWKRQEVPGQLSLSLSGFGPDAPVEAFEARCKAKDPEACYVAANLLSPDPFAYAMVGVSLDEEVDAKQVEADRARIAEAHADALEQQAKLYDRAEQLFARDCKRGDARACWSRGHMHEAAGELEAARTHYEQACDADEAKGCLARARLMLTAAEHPDAMGAASDWLARSCALDPSHGCGELALIIECGLGVDADAARAAELYQRACEGENRAACQRFE